MRINGNTKVSKVIKENKEAIEAIASLNSHFTKLRNPILRRLLAPRVSIAEAAKIGKCEVQEMLNALVKIGFELEENVKENTQSNSLGENDEVKDFLVNLSVISLDVRPILAKGEDPFNVLQKALKKLNKNEALEVLIDFEPIPLIRIQEKKGFLSFTTVKDGVYHTYFKSGGTAEKETENQNKSIKKIDESQYNRLVEEYPGIIKTMDVRNLEMPEPMIRILEVIQELEENTGLKIYHKRIPQHLLPELEDKNLNTFICPISEGNVMLFITHKNVQSRNK
ncbi:hypothetical protein CW751_02245 [Brumimicrobium salinarum]|uniref:DUF2249 domain-containing protein n=1 Tax=Brumimicrobium salinarum TaxID=2058658 RepID=A0A2I0R6H1_9FLAO|nr:DUF2249 domain-containing protein [Brumimicrobium salinarum]PKR82176.1 hypothetical protein CW751_02245 [Brumimicrobium salinarum]